MKRNTHSWTAHSWLGLLALLALLPFYALEARVAAPDQAGLRLSHPGGYYPDDVRLALLAPRPGATILFTRDGSLPTPGAAEVYDSPISLSARPPAVYVIRARLWPAGEAPGPVVSASYFLGIQPGLPLVSLIAEPADLWDADRGIYANPLPKGAEWERPAHVTYVAETGETGFVVPAGLRIHGGFTRSYDKKSFRLYFRNEYGHSRLLYDLFAEEGEPADYKRLVLHNGGQDSSQVSTNWLLLRNQLIGRLAQEVGGTATHSRPVLLFLNGELWGLYQLRERIDERFLLSHFGLGQADLLDTPEELAGFPVTVSGDRVHWNHLVQYLEGHDLSDPAVYAYVASQVDIDNFLDYAILQIYSANTDWPQHNVNQFRPRQQGGRWQWLFWDNDFSFALAPQSALDMNMIVQALKLDRANRDTRRDTLLLRKLLESPIFREHFLSRTADLLNTALAPEAVLAQVDDLASELQPGIPYEVGRWGSAGEWAASVEALRAFAQQRPEYVRHHLIEHFNLPGSATLTFAASEPGTVAVNGAAVPALPWQGIYFQGTTIRVTAVPAPGYRFAGWLESGETSPSLAIAVIGPQTLTARFEPLPAGTPLPGDVIIESYQETAIVLRVIRSGGLDLRGWRLTDNDTLAATDEGSLVFADHPALAAVPAGTTIYLHLACYPARLVPCPADDLDAGDGLLRLSVAGGLLDSASDPGFHLGRQDNLVLLTATGRGIAFASATTAVTPGSFGVLADGVLGQ